MTFTTIAFVDTFDLVASLPQRMGLFRDFGNGTRTLIVHGRRRESDDDTLVWYYAKWPEMRNLIGELRRIGDARLGEIEFGAAYLEMIDPGTATAWHRPEVEAAFIRAELALRTNPQAWLFAGRASTHLLPGQLTAIARDAWSCAANWGEHSRIHLVVEFRKKPETDSFSGS